MVFLYFSSLRCNIQVVNSIMRNDIPKSTQDRLGKFLSSWRNNFVSKEIRAPFLDIACGDNRLARSINGGKGIDVIDHGDADFIVDNFINLPFDNETFKTILIVASINYFDDPVKVLLECSRLLTSDGSTLITMINPLIGNIWHFFREPWAKAPGFSSKDILIFSQAAGLNIIKKRKFMFGFNTLYILTKA